MEDEAVWGNEVLAHWGRRYLGNFIDEAGAIAFGYGLFYSLASLIDRDRAGAIAFSILMAYLLFSDALANGQSLGKRLLKIKVVDFKTGKPCSVLQSFLRNVTIFLGLFDLIFLISRYRRRFGDFLASTLVIKE